MGTIAENIGYGLREPRDLMLAFTIDDGVPDRGHRQAIYDPVLCYLGVVCGPHATYDVVCVFVFSQERPS